MNYETVGSIPTNDDIFMLIFTCYMTLIFLVGKNGRKIYIFLSFLYFLYFNLYLILIVLLN